MNNSLLDRIVDAVVFPHNRRLDMANLSEIHPIFYFLPPLWYPGFPFVEVNSQVAAWKSNSCSINYEVFF